MHSGQWIQLNIEAKPQQTEQIEEAVRMLGLFRLHCKMPPINPS